MIVAAQRWTRVQPSQHVLDGTVRMRDDRRHGSSGSSENLQVGVCMLATVNRDIPRGFLPAAEGRRFAAEACHVRVIWVLEQTCAASRHRLVVVVHERDVVRFFQVAAGVGLDELILG
jgi:hypothetical protein